MDKHVLLVEDTLTQAMLYQHTMESHGLPVKIARSAREALENIEKERPALLITDINMPEISGYELCRRLKDNPDTAVIPVVLMGSAVAPSEIVEIVNCGADDFILKSLSDDALVLRIQEAMSIEPVEETDNPQRVTIGDHSLNLRIGGSRCARLLASLYSQICTLGKQQ